MSTLEKERGKPGAGDFYLIVSQAGTWYVSPETAGRVGAALDRRFRPRWIKFVDVYGGRVWLRTDRVESVFESTERVRARSREFHQAWMSEGEDAPEQGWENGG
ncbi:MAG TPA: hypothetical protein VF613_23930 [Longimicrobium sp.]|jgi:hypothetical protein